MCVSFRSSSVAKNEAHLRPPPCLPLALSKLAMWLPVAIFVTDNVVGIVSVEGASMSVSPSPSARTKRNGQSELVELTTFSSFSPRSTPSGQSTQPATGSF